MGQEYMGRIIVSEFWGFCVFWIKNIKNYYFTLSVLNAVHFLYKCTLFCDNSTGNTSVRLIKLFLTWPFLPIHALNALNTQDL